MKIILTKRAKQDILFWKQNNQKYYTKVLDLIENIKFTPYSGLGKPEPLRYELSGYWSRRINNEHRLVYKLLKSSSTLVIHSCKGHYKN